MSLTLIIGLTLLGVVIGAALIAFGHKPVPPVERRALMTQAELRFWHILEKAVPEARVMSQVAMGALLKPVPGLDQREHMTTRARFSQKIVDFVIVDPRHGSVLGVVELDDGSHASKRQADQARDAMLARAGYTILRVPTRPWPTVQLVRAALEDASLVALGGFGP